MHSELMSVPPLLRKYIQLFQLLGFFSLSLSSSPQRRYCNERLLRAWSLALLLLFNVFVIYICTSGEDFLFLYDSFGHFNDVLKLSIAHIAIMTIYFESLLRRNALHRFWTLYARLNKSRLTLPEEGSQSWRQHRRFVGIFFFINVVSLMCWLLFICLQKFSRHLVLFWSMFAPYIYVVHYRNMEVILHIEIMRLELETLKEDLHLLVDYSKFGSRVSTFPGFEEFLRRKLLHKQKVYASIFEMFESFQSGFGYSIVACFLKVFVRLMVDAYFIFYVVYTDIDQMAEIVLILQPLLEIPALLLTARNCMNVVMLISKRDNPDLENLVKRISFELHNIFIQVSGNSALSVQIQNFSLQILHQKIRIDGVGITTMDGYMLLRVVGSVTTYMIFLIQFMPKFRKI